MKLDIGGGTLSPAGWTNVDPLHGAGEFKRRIQDGLPHLADCSVEAVRASHVMEHIPSGHERLAAMNEIHRVLKVGRQFEIIVPCVGYTDHAGDGSPKYAGWQAWADPTHVSYWWYPESFRYFTTMRAHADYGIRYWDEGHFEIRDGWEAAVTLIKPGG